MIYIACIRLSDNDDYKKDRWIIMQEDVEN